MSTNDIGLLDTVRIGKGKVLWQVEGFDVFADGKAYVFLRCLTGYSNTSVTPDRLTVVTKATA